LAPLEARVMRATLYYALRSIWLRLRIGWRTWRRHCLICGEPTLASSEALANPDRGERLLALYCPTHAELLRTILGYLL
jgi:hypothetical protein